MTPADFVFIALAILTLTAGFMAVALKNVFYNALSLILCLFGVAALFIYLNSEFLAVMEIIIYIGAISIAIIFAIMLSQPMFDSSKKTSPAKIGRAAFVAAILFLSLQKVLHKTHWPSVSTDGDYSMRAIGKNLLTTSVLPFETISLILLVAIIGALLISDTDAKDAP